jgi:hypothetical protein
MDMIQTATSVATMVLCSALIVIRIYKMSLPNYPFYSTLTTMFIESASLYSIFGVLWTVFQFLDLGRPFEGGLYIECFFTAMIVSPQHTPYPPFS